MIQTTPVMPMSTCHWRGKARTRSRGERGRQVRMQAFLDISKKTQGQKKSSQKKHHLVPQAWENPPGPWVLCLSLKQGVFLPVFKKLKAALKKLKPSFGKKLNAMEATLGIKKKNSIFLAKISRIYSRVLWIFNKFVEFSKY